MTKTLKRSTVTSKTIKRKAPAEHAADLAEHTVIEHSGKMWIVKVMPNGTHRWVQDKASITLDNGGSPFRVVEEGSKIAVYKSSTAQEDLPNRFIGIYNKRILELPCKKLFIGKNTGPFVAKWYLDNEFPGSAVLINTTGTTYVHVGSEIAQFEAPDTIVKYYSIMGNSDVVYPYAVGKTCTYLLIGRDYVYTENTNIPEGTDPYQHYYSYIRNRRQKDSPWKALKTRTLVKRLF